MEVLTKVPLENAVRKVREHRKVGSPGLEDFF